MPRLLALPIMALLLMAAAGCQSTPEHLEVEDPLADASFTLVDQDSQAVTFPDDFEGAPTLVGYIYTHCPDVCPMTTANMKRVRDSLGTGSDVRFVSITFDPARDTPAMLRGYADVWGLDSTDWRFLTGDSTTIAALMGRMGIRYQVDPPPTSRAALTQPDTTAAPASYLVSHTDEISLLDARGRLVETYGGSRTPPEILIEDLQALR